MKSFISILLFCLVLKANSHGMSVVFSWKQISYNFDGVIYTKSSDYDRTIGYNVHFADELQDAEKFFIQYNNVPIGFEVYGDTVFVTVPRRRHGIPSTLNYVKLSDANPVLRPYPDITSSSLVSVYRPRVDECGRLWMVDTGLLEVPGERKQIQPPTIVVYDLNSNRQILRYQLKPTDLVDEKTPGGLTSIAVDVGCSCEDTYAYINDLATNGLIVFSLRERDSWRIQDDSFKLDEGALNFTVAGHVINWRDGLFSVALSNRDATNCRTAFFHPLVSTQEFGINTAVLKSSRHGYLSGKPTLLGTRGPLTQSGSHDYYNGMLFFANVAQDGILCWNTRKPLTPENMVLVAQDHEKLVYISDLKVKAGEVWVLVNQIPRFVYSTLDPTQNNFYILKGRVPDLIKNTRCA
ncbi:L-dopachrome tautomerase yellow-f-like [Leguminivora glycinivorella]|uniref:L-dopachrome tautomerase yellow-f-like n=1 Tax=Leguminivora glycinivorella TaxID=1035111 RepID=UPI00200BB5ED|nr:L-dopachrome tautomerase yellow-f-like [Leguminivora glycinivorella]